MSKRIIIGIPGSPADRRRASTPLAELAGAGIEAEVVFFSPAEIFAGLLRGEADAALLPLNRAPVGLPEGLVITAVSERKNPAECLLVRRENTDAGKLFGLPDQALVCAPGAGRQVQIRDFRPDIRPAGDVDDAGDILEKLYAGEWDAAILAAADLDEQAEATFRVVRFHPREFVPAPGQGVMAWISCKDNLHTRRLLKAVHHPEASAVTNIERGVLRLLGGDPGLPLGVYAEYDGQGAYHVWAAYADGVGSPLRRARMSSSTSFQLAEKVADELT